MVLYGQTLQKELPLVGLGASWSLMVCAEVMSTTAISAYLLDIFPHHAALASAWLNFWRTTGKSSGIKISQYHGELTNQ